MLEFSINIIMNSLDTDKINKIKSYPARVTIVSPTFNRAELIVSTIESIFEQQYKDYKYIIIDDGSTDQTIKIVQKLFKNKKNCFYLHHDNIGEAKTVNIGWNICNSEYFLQVNSDDTIEPNLLQEMVASLDSNADAVGAYSDFYVINKTGMVTENFKNVEWNFIDALSAFSCYPAAPGAVIRKSAFKDLKKIKDENFKYINDIKMIWNMALRGDFVYIPQSLASWRSHEGGISADRYKSINEVTAWADEYFSQKDLPVDVKNAEKKCRESIDGHCLRLLERSSVEPIAVNVVKYLVESKKELTNEITVLAHDNDILSVINKENEDRIIMLTNSLSWKITIPLREISKFIKKVIRVIKRIIRNKL